MASEESVIQVVVPQRDQVEVDLSPRSQLGGPPSTGPLTGRLSLVPPLLFRVNPEEVGDDEFLKAYVRSEAVGCNFYALDLVVNVRPGEEESFIDLSVGVRLSYPNREDVAPIAWSISPMRSSLPFTVRSTIGLNGKFGVVDAKLERAIDAPGEQTYVSANGLRESDFEWRYTPTKQRPLAGPQQMQAVIKSLRDEPVRSDVVVSATVSLSGFGRRQYRAKLPPRLETVFV